MSAEQNLENSPTRVTIAFLLGWSISEVMGHLRKGTRPPSQSPQRPADYAPRLVAAHGTPEKSMDEFILAAQRVAQFYRELGFESDDQASTLTKEIYALPQRVEDWLTGKLPQFVSPKELREELNSWSLGVWARLDAEAPANARAFTAGMSIADTYWYWRPPHQRPHKARAQTSQEDWHKLLSRSRLDVERSRLQSLKANLPRYAVAVMQKHLRQWSIGKRVIYQNEQLVLAEVDHPPSELTPQDEVKLQRALGHQMEKWDAMLFGLREATTYLHTSDRRWITGLRIGGLTLMLFATALVLGILALVVSLYLSVNVLPVVVQFLNDRQAKVSEWLTLFNLLWTLLIAAPVPFVLRQFFQGTRGFHQWLDEQLTIWFIAQRTYVPWNRFLMKAKKGAQNDEQ